MGKIAHCCCGALRVEVTADPVIVAACHCTQCQRRTGAPFGVSAYFPKAAARTEGVSKVYVRQGESGAKVEAHFCPECGSTVFWYAEFRGDLIGVALGAFADPSFLPPKWSVWEATRHPWVSFDHALKQYPGAVSNSALES